MPILYVFLPELLEPDLPFELPQAVRLAASAVTVSKDTIFLDNFIMSSFLIAMEIL